MAKMNAFDRHPAEYDAWFDRHVDIYQAELAAVRELVPAQGRGVEIGVGTGRFAAPLGIALGVEPSPGMAQLARQRGIEVLSGTAEALPLPDACFDYAVIVTVLCFVEDVARVLAEVRRVLKPGGSLIIGFIDRESALGESYERKKSGSDFYREATFRSAAELEALLTEAGFSGFSYRQTLLPAPAGLSVSEGHGRGGFAVVKTIKNGKEK
mgnify:CR=1 FL=1